MKPLPGCLIVLALNGISWADFGTMPASRQAKASNSPAPQHKQKKATAAAPARVAHAASPTAPPVVSVIAPLQRVLDTVMPGPARNVLDEAVMEKNALAPLLASSSPAVPTKRRPPRPLASRSARSCGTVPCSGTGDPWMAPPPLGGGVDSPPAAGGNDDLPAGDDGMMKSSLRATVGRWLIDSSYQGDFAISGGEELFHVGSQTDTAPAIALRLVPCSEFRVSGSDSELETRNSKLETGCSPWSLEAGAVLPHEVSGDFATASRATPPLPSGGAIDQTVYSARVQSYYEVHLAAIRQLPHGGESWLVPEAGFGVSMLHVVDQIYSVTPYTYSYQINGFNYSYTYYFRQGNEAVRYAFSPLCKLGLALFPDHVISARIEPAYVGYGNAPTAQGQTFDLGLTGLEITSLLQVRL